MANENSLAEKKVIQGKSGVINRLSAKPHIAWSTDWAKDGDTVEMLARVLGFPDKTPATFTIYKYDIDGNFDMVQDGIKGEVSDSRVETQWQFQYQDRDDINKDLNFENDYTLPEFIFEVKIIDRVFRSNNVLQYFGGPYFVDEDEVPIDDMMVIAKLPDGQVIPCKIRKGYLTEPYLWQRGKVTFHLDDNNIGGIE